MQFYPLGTKRQAFLKRSGTAIYTVKIMSLLTWSVISIVSLVGVRSYDLNSLANPFLEAFEQANNAINSYDCAQTMFESEFPKRIYDCIGKEIPQVTEGIIDCFDNQSLTDAIRSFCGKYSELSLEDFQLKVECMEQNIGRLDYNLKVVKQKKMTFDTPFSIFYEACLANTMGKEGVSGEISYNNKIESLLTFTDSFDGDEYYGLEDEYYEPEDEYYEPEDEYYEPEDEYNDEV